MRNKILIGLAAVAAAVVAVVLLMRKASAAGTGSGNYGSNGSPLEVGPRAPGGAAAGLPLQALTFNKAVTNLADRAFINAITVRTPGFSTAPGAGTGSNVPKIGWMGI